MSATDIAISQKKTWSNSQSGRSHFRHGGGATSALSRLSPHAAPTSRRRARGLITDLPLLSRRHFRHNSTVNSGARSRDAVREKHFAKKLVIPVVAMSGWSKVSHLPRATHSSPPRRSPRRRPSETSPTRRTPANAPFSARGAFWLRKSDARGSDWHKASTPVPQFG